MGESIQEASEDNYYARNESITHQGYELAITEQNPAVVPYPERRFDLSLGDHQILTYIEPSIALNELYWQTKKDISPEEVVKIIVDLLPLAKEELKQYYVKEAQNQFTKDIMAIKYENMQDEIIEIKREGFSKENLDDIVAYDNIRTLAIGTGVGLISLHMSLHAYKEPWNAKKSQLGFYFNERGKETFNAFYQKTTNVNLNDIFSSLGIQGKVERSLFEKITD